MYILQKHGDKETHIKGVWEMAAGWGMGEGNMNKTMNKCVHLPQISITSNSSHLVIYEAKRTTTIIKHMPLHKSRAMFTLVTKVQSILWEGNHVDSNLILLSQWNWNLEAIILIDLGSDELRNSLKDQRRLYCRLGVGKAGPEKSTLEPDNGASKLLI